MRKVLMSLALASATIVTAAPAAAQIYPPARGLTQQLSNQIRVQEQRIERSAQRRAITGNEYRALREHARELRQRLMRFARNGLSRGEIQDIRDRIDNLGDRIRDERRDGRRHR